jgi:hypothetical protein
VYCVTNFRCFVYCRVGVCISWRDGRIIHRHRLTVCRAPPHRYGDRAVNVRIVGRVFVIKTVDVRCMTVKLYCVFAMFNFFYCI